MKIYVFESALRFLSLDDPYILKTLKRDLLTLEQELLLNPPKLLLGIGRGPKTCYEPVAINRFHRNPHIVEGRPDQLSLFVPSSAIPVSSLPTTSFCNWSAYLLADFIEQEKLSTKISLLHFRPEDADRVMTEVSRLSKIF